MNSVVFFFYKINMKYIFLLFTFTSFSQEVSRSTISVVGNSTTTINGYYVSQSVGQLSTTGFAEMFNQSIVQGYQQPTGIKTIDTSIEIETLQLYPIPVSNELNLLFSLSLEGKCTVELFDRLGRLVLNKELTINDFKNININTKPCFFNLFNQNNQQYQCIL